MYLIDCSMYPNQGWLRTAHGQIAVYPDLESAEQSVSVLGGKVVSAAGHDVHNLFNYTIV